MSCVVCELCQERFNSEKEFVEFRQRIAQMVEMGELKSYGQIDHSGPFIKIQYKCKHCGQLWVLEFPDQAFRGGWKKVL